MMSNSHYEPFLEIMITITELLCCTTVPECKLHLTGDLLSYIRHVFQTVVGSGIWVGISTHTILKCNDSGK